MRKRITTAWTFLIFCTKKVNFWSCFDVIVDIFLQPETQFDQSPEPEAERRLRAAEGACDCDVMFRLPGLRGHHCALCLMQPAFFCFI